MKAPCSVMIKLNYGRLLFLELSACHLQSILPLLLSQRSQLNKNQEVKTRFFFLMKPVTLGLFLHLEATTRLVSVWPYQCCRSPLYRVFLAVSKEDTVVIASLAFCIWSSLLSSRTLLERKSFYSGGHQPRLGFSTHHTNQHTHRTQKKRGVILHTTHHEEQRLLVVLHRSRSLSPWVCRRHRRRTDAVYNL